MNGSGCGCGRLTKLSLFFAAFASFARPRSGDHNSPARGRLLLCVLVGVADVDGVVAVAGGAALRDAALRAVAFGAAFLGGQQDVLGAMAGLCGVALRAGDYVVFGVVELAPDEPAVGRGDRDYLRQAVRTAMLHVVAVGAAGETGARGDVARGCADGELLGWVAGKEELLFKVLAAEDALAELVHLLGDKFFSVGLRGHAGAAGEIGVLRREAAEVGADAGGIAVWQAHLRVARIELEGVAALAVLREGGGCKCAPAAAGWWQSAQERGWPLRFTRSER